MFSMKNMQLMKNMMKIGTNKECCENMDKHIFLTDKMKENGYFVLVTMKNETDISIEFSKKIY